MPEFLGNLRTPRLATAPSTPQPGEMYYDTTTNKLMWWDGTKWVDASGGGGGSASSVGAFEVYLLAASTKRAANATWPVVFDDVGAGSSSWYNPATGRYTPQEPGWYVLNCFLTVDVALTLGTANWRGWLLKNGVQWVQLGETSQSLSPNQPRVGGSITVYANGSTDFFELAFHHTDSATHGVYPGSYSYFSGGKLGGAKGDKGDLGGTMDASLCEVSPVIQTGIVQATWTRFSIPNANFSATPASDFTRNSDGTITINKAGTYSFDAHALPNEAKATGAIFEMRLCLKAGAVPSISDYWAVDDANSGAANAYITVHPSTVVQCAAGTVFAPWVYMSSGAGPHSINLYRCTITREGGTQGVKGADGTNLAAEAGGWTGTTPVAMTGGVYQLLPVGTTVDANNTDGVTRQTDGTIQVQTAGWYIINGLFQSVGAPGASQIWEYRIVGAVGTLPGSSGAAPLGILAMHDEGMVAGEGPHQNVSTAPVWLPSGSRIGFYLYASAAFAAGAFLARCGIARIGGPRGADGTMEVYSQPSMPVSTNTGAIWIDTDETPPPWQQVIQQTYAITPGYTPLRSFNPASFTNDQLARFMATMVDDMKAAGMIRP